METHFWNDKTKHIHVAVITLDLLGKVHRTQQLPVPVGRFLRNGRLMYAWCPAKYGFQKWKGALFGNHSLSEIQLTIYIVVFAIYLALAINNLSIHNFFQM